MNNYIKTDNNLKNLSTDVSSGKNKLNYRYRALPPLNPFHALLRSICKIGDRKSRARKSEAVGVAILFYLHWSIAPYAFFCIGLNKLAMKAPGIPVHAVGMWEGVIWFLIVGVLLRFTKDACCYRRVHDFGEEKPKTLDDAYVVGAKNRLLVPIVGWLLVGNPIFSYDRGDVRDNAYGKSPTYVYVGTEEEQLAFKKRYRRIMFWEIVTFIIGVACIASIFYFAYCWKGKNIEQQYQYSAPMTTNVANNNSVNSEESLDADTLCHHYTYAEDVLGTWITTQTNFDGKVDTIIVELKDKKGKIAIKVNGSKDFGSYDGFLIDDKTVESDSIKYPIFLKSNGYNYYFAYKKNNAVMYHSCDTEKRIVNFPGDANMTIIDKTDYKSQTFFKIQCNNSKTLLKIEVLKDSRNYFYYKDSLIKVDSNSKVQKLLNLKKRNT